MTTVPHAVLRRSLPTIEDYALPVATDLPASIATWRTESDRAVLLVHDMQRYFLRPFPDALRRRLVSNVVALRRWADAHGVPVAYSAQPGDMTDAQRGLIAAFWGSGMHRDPDDRDVVAGLEPAQGDWLLPKWRYSAFHGTDLLARIRASGRSQLLVCGVYAHIGVQATAVEAFSHDLETFVVADAVADFSQRDHLDALDYTARHCAVVVTTHDVAGGR